MPKGEALKRLKAHQERMTRLSAIKAGIAESTSKLTGTSDLIKLTAKKANITHRLRALCSEGKMTPAEFKSMVSADDLTHLAKLDDATLKIALKPYEAREKPVIKPGQVGTTDAVDFKSLSDGMKKGDIKNLRAEVASDFKRLTGKNLVKGEDDVGSKVDKKMAAVPGAEPAKVEHDKGAVPGEGGDEKQLAEMHANLSKCLEAGDVSGAKVAHDELKKHMGGVKHMSEYTGDVKSEDHQKAMGDQQKQIDELSTQMSRLAGMVSEMFDAEKEEGHELEAGLEPKEKKDGEPAAAAS